MIKRAALAAAVFLAAFGAARADQVVLVELYTSQGCSSCPPADAILAQLADRDDVIALALHVDYWDYLGWKDDFAEPGHAERQRAYARAKGKTMIYTPQMVVQGETHVIGTKAMDLNDALRAHAAADAPVSVTLERTGERVNVTARSAGPLPADIVVQIVTYTPSASRDIRRGENAGRTLTYRNIVEDWRAVDTWDGQGTYRAALNAAAGRPVVVVFQAAGHGPVLGTARLR